MSGIITCGDQPLPAQEALLRLPDAVPIHQVIDNSTNFKYGMGRMWSFLEFVYMLDSSCIHNDNHGKILKGALAVWGMVSLKTHLPKGFLIWLRFSKGYRFLKIYLKNGKVAWFFFYYKTKLLDLFAFKPKKIYFLYNKM